MSENYSPVSVEAADACRAGADALEAKGLLRAANNLRATALRLERRDDLTHDLRLAMRHRPDGHPEETVAYYAARKRVLNALAAGATLNYGSAA